jgi:hypothetical protein
MTLALAWTRKISTCEELIVASDSRLSGGRNIDCCQKILALPNGAFICFAGDTQFAYPLMQQVSMAILSYGRAADRSMDLAEVRGYILKIFDRLLEAVNSPIRGRGQTTPDASFLFGGYSWIQKRFSVWIIRYHEGRRCFVYETPPRASGGAIVAFAGDNDVRTEARRRLMAGLRQRSISLRNDAAFGFDWEPFEILRDMLRESEGASNSVRTGASIGGAPQIMKVYQHMNCRPLGVYWPDKETNQIFIGGRKLLGFEKPDVWILDPDSKITSHVRISENPPERRNESLSGEG